MEPAIRFLGSGQGVVREPFLAGSDEHARPRLRGGMLFSVVAMAFVACVLPSAVQAQGTAGGGVPKFHTRKPPEGTPVHVLAETIIYDSRRDVATALGRVQITWGPYVLLARKVVYNRRTDRFQAEGEVHLREPNGNVLVADLVNIDDRFRDGFARHLRLIMTNGATMKARYAVRREGYITTYTDVAYTACKTCRLEGGVPLWEIRSEEAVHDERAGRIYHRNMTLRFADVPVFWLPRISHPDPRHPRSTGFLAPRISYSADLGVGVGIPYFVNLAPNYDITLIPTLYSKRGVLARAVWRHNVGPGTYTVDAGGMYQLDPDTVAPPGNRRWRWYAKADGTFDINRRWQWGFSGAIQSDRTMMRRHDVDERDMIHSRLWIAGLDDRNYFYAETGHLNGLMDVDPKRTDQILLPWLYQEYTFDPPVLGGALTFSTSLRTILQSSANTPFTGVHVPERQSLLASRLQWQRQWIATGGLLLQPFLDVRTELRQVRNLPDPAVPGGVRSRETTARLLPAAGLDVRWPWLADFDGGYQVLTPVAQLIATTSETLRNRVGNEDAIAARYAASTLFLHDRYPGLDRFEGGVRANLGITYGLYRDDGGFLRATLGQTLHLAGRNSFAGSNSGLQRKRADLVAGVAFAPNDRFLVSWQGRFDPRSFAPRDQEAHLKASFWNLQADISYVRQIADPVHGRPDAEHQLLSEAGWRFDSGWQVFGGWRYSFRGSWTMNRFIGIGYDCDCFSMRLKYSENFTEDADAVFDRSITLSVRLLTLGGGKAVGPAF